MNRINGNAMASRILILCAALAIQFSAAICTKAQTPMTPALRVEALKTMDDFFNDLHNLALSGCDQPTWTVIYQTKRTEMQGELSPSSFDDDMSRVDQIMRCFHTASDKELAMFKELFHGLGEDGKGLAIFGDPSAPDTSAIRPMALNILANWRKNISLLQDYVNLQQIVSFAEEASQTYLDHASEARYRNLVARYNALANSLANVRLAQGSSFAIQPRPLHCDASSNPYTHVTQMDCQ
jgi:hypothetical protein